MGAKSRGFGWLWIVGLLAVLVLFKLVGMGVQSAAVEQVAPAEPVTILDPFKEPNPYAKYAQPAPNRFAEDAAPVAADPCELGCLTFEQHTFSAEDALSFARLCLQGRALHNPYAGTIFEHNEKCQRYEVAFQDDSNWKNLERLNEAPGWTARPAPSSHVIPQAELDRVNAELARERQTREHARAIADELRR